MLKSVWKISFFSFKEGTVFCFFFLNLSSIFINSRQRLDLSEVAFALRPTEVTRKKPSNDEACTGFQSMVPETKKKNEARKAPKTAFSLGNKVPCLYGWGHVCSSTQGKCFTNASILLRLLGAKHANGRQHMHRRHLSLL